MGFGIKETLNFVLTADHFWTYFRLIGVFFLLAFNGTALFYLLFKSKNKLINLGGGIILGPTVFLLLLGTLSYILKGFIGISIIFYSYTLFCFLLFKKNFTKFRVNLFTFDISLNSVSIAFITIIYLAFIGLYAKSAPIGGDVSTHWGIATSFARGNYPAVLPWQPNFLTVYHMGSFMILGAIHAIADTEIYLVHIFFSIYIIWGLFLFLTGWAREKTRSLFCFLPAVLGLILFGGPIINLNILGSLSHLITNSLSTLLNPRTIPPLFQDFRSSNGSGSSDLGSLVYGNFYAFGLAIFLLSLYLLNKGFQRKTLWKYLLLTILAVLTLSVDESVFLTEVPVIVIYFLIENRKILFKKGLLIYSICIVLFGTLFFAVQNPVRDSLLTPAKIEARFKFLTPQDGEFNDRINFVKSRIVSSENDNWLLPSLPLVIAIVLVISIIGKSSLSLQITFSALTSLVLSYIVVNTFWPANGLRFANQSSQIIMIAIGFLFLDLVKIRKKGIFVKSILVILFMVFLPQFINNNLHFFNKAKDKSANNFLLGYGAKNQSLDWISTNIPLKKNLLFLDEFPETSVHSPLTLQAVQSYGVFAPTLTTDTKMLTFEAGGEWYDATVFLTPVALKKLNIDYVFAELNGLGSLSESRRSMLSNNDYFTKVYSDNLGILYEVKPQYKKLEDDEMSLEKMARLIPDGSVVYIDTLKLSETRRGFLVFLSKRTHLVGPHYNQGGDMFMYIEDFLPLEATDDPSKMLQSEYIITREIDNLPKGNTFKKLAEIPGVSLWYNQSYLSK